MRTKRPKKNNDGQARVHKVVVVFCRAQGRDFVRAWDFIEGSSWWVSLRYRWVSMGIAGYRWVSVGIGGYRWASDSPSLAPRLIVPPPAECATRREVVMEPRRDSGVAGQPAACPVDPRTASVSPRSPGDCIGIIGGGSLRDPPL